MNSSRANPARIADTAIFFLNGFAVSNWAVRIPAFKTQLQLSDGTLGLLLFSVAVGSLLSMPLVGAACGRYGSRRVTGVLALMFAVCVTLPGLAATLGVWWMLPALLLYGATNGGLDVAMNAQATTIEASIQRPILSSFHAAWSIGSLVGAWVAGLFVQANLIPAVHHLWIGLLLLVGSVIAQGFLLSGDAHASEQTPRIKPTPALVALGLIAFCALIGEGAMSDWSTVYMRDVLGSSEAFAAYGFMAFQIGMVAARLAGDVLRARFGDPKVLVGAGVLAALGIVLGLNASTWPAMLGFVIVGLGLAVVFPAALGIASKLPGVLAGPAIGWVGSAGYAGFLVGPPLIGFVSDHSSLRVGLGLVLLAGLAIVGLSKVAGGGLGKAS